ncbi:MAG: hypothetical protein SVU94_09810, partial [Bacteroidota bacterium]|nr:hypothetical protein [Bacteroidota bacterium]
VKPQNIFTLKNSIKKCKKFEKLNIGQGNEKKSALFSYNGPALTIVRVCAVFHCPPLNNFTKIKLSQQTTKTPHFC